MSESDDARQSLRCVDMRYVDVEEFSCSSVCLCSCTSGCGVQVDVDVALVWMAHCSVCLPSFATHLQLSPCHPNPSHCLNSLIFYFFIYFTPPVSIESHLPSCKPDASLPINASHLDHHSTTIPKRFHDQPTSPHHDITTSSRPSTLATPS